MTHEREQQQLADELARRLTRPLTSVDDLDELVAMGYRLEEDDGVAERTFAWLCKDELEHT